MRDKEKVTQRLLSLRKRIFSHGRESGTVSWFPGWFIRVKTKVANPRGRTIHLPVCSFGESYFRCGGNNALQRCTLILKIYFPCRKLLSGSKLYPGLHSLFTSYKREKRPFSQRDIKYFMNSEPCFTQFI